MFKEEIVTATLTNRPAVDVKTAADALSNDVVLTPYEPGQGLPLFIQPNTPKLCEDTEYALAWLEEKRPVIEQTLVSAGAVVLRGFPMDRSIHFARFTSGYGSFETGYMGGTDVRQVVVDKVLTTNVLRADLTLDIHQEMSYMRRFPKRIAFYCRMAPVTGGSTMLCDMREVTARMDPVLFNEVAKRGIRLVRNYLAPGSDRSHPVIGKFHKTWTEAFETDEPAKAEATCRDLGFNVVWRDNGSLEAFYNLPGIATHPGTGEQIWFNQASMYAMTPESHPDLYSAWAEAYPSGKARPMTTTFGDGAPIPMEPLVQVAAIQRELAVRFPWSHGDMLLIDNYAVGHGRAGFSGKRDIQVALLGG
jgi:alpha-ketoglutarate-dependent taurine dioxygenase